MAQNNTSRVLRAAVVGCGGIAQVHAAVLASLEQVELAACADIVPERAQKLADRFGFKSAYGSLEEMLDKERIDVLHVCTPHVLHIPMAEQAAERGINIFMEKPPAMNRDQLNRLIKLYEKAKIGICFQNRYNPNVLYAKQILNAGELGKILGARAFVTWSRDKNYYESGGWHGKWSTEGGGVLMNQSIHTLDLLVSFLGNPSSAEAHMSNHHLKNWIEVEDTMEAYIDFQDRPALFYATTAYRADAPVLLEFCCENGTVRLEGAETVTIQRNARSEHISFAKQDTTGKDYWGSGHSTLIRKYYECLRTGERFPVEIPDVLQTMELTLGLYQSCRENSTVYY